jgi:hypothetical protein
VSFIVKLEMENTPGPPHNILLKTQPPSPSQSEVNATNLKDKFVEVGLREPTKPMGKVALHQNLPPITCNHKLGLAPAAGPSALERHCRLVEGQEHLTKEVLEYLVKERKDRVSTPVAEGTNVHLNEESATLLTDGPWNTIGTVQYNEHQRHILQKQVDKQSWNRQPFGYGIVSA